MGGITMKMNKKGFTLIELLIVVSIIAILAAIAIPQFSAYRIKGYNAAATADLRNARTAMESFFSDWQVYSSSKADGTPGTGLVLSNTSANPQATVVKNTISATAPSADTTFNTGISQNVNLVIETSANGGTFTMVSKNSSGDRCFGADSDFTPIYWINGSVAGNFTNAAVPAAIASSTTSDFLGAGGKDVCNGLADGSGLKIWGAL